MNKSNQLAVSRLALAEHGALTFAMGALVFAWNDPTLGSTRLFFIYYTLGLALLSLFATVDAPPRLRQQLLIYGLVSFGVFVLMLLWPTTGPGTTGLMVGMAIHTATLGSLLLLAVAQNSASPNRPVLIGLGALALLLTVALIVGYWSGPLTALYIFGGACIILGAALLLGSLFLRGASLQVATS